MTKNRDEIEALKEDWRLDPCYDLEDVEGFEEHREELRAYADRMYAEWNKRDKGRAYAWRRERPAFPLAPDFADAGMNLRTYIATQAMMGMLAADFDYFAPSAIAMHSVDLADALIAELNK